MTATIFEKFANMMDEVIIISFITISQFPFFHMFTGHLNCLSQELPGLSIIFFLYSYCYFPWTSYLFSMIKILSLFQLHMLKVLSSRLFLFLIYFVLLKILNFLKSNFSSFFFYLIFMCCIEGFFTLPMYIHILLKLL